MRDRGRLSLGLLLLLGAGAFAQQPAGVPVRALDELPGLVLPLEPGPLANGVPVSQPLQPVAEPFPVTPLPGVPVVEPPSVPPRRMPASWYRAELLLWWPKGQPMPPVAVVGQEIPRLGSPGVSALGGQSLPSPDTAGGRFVVGWALSDNRTHGFEVSYFFLGTNTQSTSLYKTPVGRAQYLGRPYISAATGSEEVALVAGPGNSGELTASTSGRFTGWEASVLRSLLDGPTFRVSALAGYRYFMANEGLRVESRTLVPPSIAVTPGPLTLPAHAMADQFDAHNRFHGGQVGLRADVERGAFFAELDAKIGFGRTVEVVRVSGLTAFDGGPVVSTGIYGQPSNAGRVARASFAVLPEAGLRVGWKLGEKSRVSLGYTLIYLSDAVRPGDQLDRVLDLPGTGGGFGDRPAPLFVRSDLWVQGLSLGLEWRY